MKETGLGPDQSRNRPYSVSTLEEQDHRAHLSVMATGKELTIRRKKRTKAMQANNIMSKGVSIALTLGLVVASIWLIANQTASPFVS